MKKQAHKVPAFSANIHFSILGIFDIIVLLKTGGEIYEVL